MSVKLCIMPSFLNIDVFFFVGNECNKHLWTTQNPSSGPKRLAHRALDSPDIIIELIEPIIS